MAIGGSTLMTYKVCTSSLIRRCGVVRALNYLQLARFYHMQLQYNEKSPCSTEN